MVKRMKKTCRREWIAFPQLCKSFEPFILLSTAHKLTFALSVCFRFTCINVRWLSTGTFTMMDAIHHLAMKTSVVLGAWMVTNLGAHMATTGTSTDVAAHTAIEALGACMGTEAWLVWGAIMGMGTCTDLGTATPSLLVLETDTAIETAIHAETAEIATKKWNAGHGFTAKVMVLRNTEHPCLWLSSVGHVGARLRKTILYATLSNISCFFNYCSKGQLELQQILRHLYSMLRE